jgi:hypothetical protein
MNIISRREVFTDWAVVDLLRNKFQLHYENLSIVVLILEPKKNENYSSKIPINENSSLDFHQVILI